MPPPPRNLKTKPLRQPQSTAADILKKAALGAAQQGNAAARAKALAKAAQEAAKRAQKQAAQQAALKAKLAANQAKAQAQAREAARRNAEAAAKRLAQKVAAQRAAKIAARNALIARRKLAAQQRARELQQRVNEQAQRRHLMELQQKQLQEMNRLQTARAGALNAARGGLDSRGAVADAVRSRDALLENEAKSREHVRAMQRNVAYTQLGDMTKAIYRGGTASQMTRPISWDGETWGQPKDGAPESLFEWARGLVQKGIQVKDQLVQHFVDLRQENVARIGDYDPGDLTTGVGLEGELKDLRYRAIQTHGYGVGNEEIDAVAEAYGKYRDNVGKKVLAKIDQINDLNAKIEQAKKDKNQGLYEKLVKQYLKLVKDKKFKALVKEYDRLEKELPKFMEDFNAVVDAKNAPLLAQIEADEKAWEDYVKSTGKPVGEILGKDWLPAVPGLANSPLVYRTRTPSEYQEHMEVARQRIFKAQQTFVTAQLKQAEGLRNSVPGKLLDEWRLQHPMTSDEFDEYLVSEGGRNIPSMGKEMMDLWYQKNPEPDVNMYSEDVRRYINEHKAEIMARSANPNDPLYYPGYRLEEDVLDLPAIQGYAATALLTQYQAKAEQTKRSVYNLFHSSPPGVLGELVSIPLIDGAITTLSALGMSPWVVWRLLQPGEAYIRDPSRWLGDENDPNAGLTGYNTSPEALARENKRRKELQEAINKGDWWAAARAVADYGSDVYQDDTFSLDFWDIHVRGKDIANLSYNIVGDITNLIPLNFVKYPARVRAGLRAARDSSASNRLLKAGIGLHTGVRVSEESLKRSDALQKLLSQIDGVSTEDATRILREELAGIKNTSEIPGRVEEAMRKMGLTKEPVVFAQLMSVSEDVLWREIRKNPKLADLRTEIETAEAKANQLATEEAIKQGERRARFEAAQKAEREQAEASRAAAEAAAKHLDAARKAEAARDAFKQAREEAKAAREAFEERVRAAANAGDDAGEQALRDSERLAAERELAEKELREAAAEAQAAGDAQLAKAAADEADRMAELADAIEEAAAKAKERLAQIKKRERMDRKNERARKKRADARREREAKERVEARRGQARNEIQDEPVVHITPRPEPVRPSARQLAKEREENARLIKERGFGMTQAEQLAMRRQYELERPAVVEAQIMHGDVAMARATRVSGTAADNDHAAAIVRYGSRPSSRGLDDVEWVDASELRDSPVVQDMYAMARDPKSTPAQKRAAIREIQDAAFREQQRFLYDNPSTLNVRKLDQHAGAETPVEAAAAREIVVEVDKARRSVARGKGIPEDLAQKQVRESVDRPGRFHVVHRSDTLSEDAPTLADDLAQWANIGEPHEWYAPMNYDDVLERGSHLDLLRVKPTARSFARILDALGTGYSARLTQGLVGQFAFREFAEALFALFHGIQLEPGLVSLATQRSMHAVAVRMAMGSIENPRTLLARTWLLMESRRGLDFALPFDVVNGMAREAAGSFGMLPEMFLRQFPGPARVTKGLNSFGFEPDLENLASGIAKDGTPYGGALPHLADDPNDIQKRLWLDNLWKNRENPLSLPEFVRNINSHLHYAVTEKTSVAASYFHANLAGRDAKEILGIAEDANFIRKTDSSREMFKRVQEHVAAANVSPQVKAAVAGWTWEDFENWAYKYTRSRRKITRRTQQTENVMGRQITHRGNVTRWEWQRLNWGDPLDRAVGNAFSHSSQKMWRDGVFRSADWRTTIANHLFQLQNIVLRGSDEDWMRVAMQVVRDVKGKLPDDQIADYMATLHQRQLSRWIWSLNDQTTIDGARSFLKSDESKFWRGLGLGPTSDSIKANLERKRGMLSYEDQADVLWNETDELERMDMILHSEDGTRNFSQGRRVVLAERDPEDLGRLTQREILRRRELDRPGVVGPPQPDPNLYSTSYVQMREAGFTSPADRRVFFRPETDRANMPEAMRRPVPQHVVDAGVTPELSDTLRAEAVELRVADDPIEVIEQQVDAEIAREAADAAAAPEAGSVFRPAAEQVPPEFDELGRAAQIYEDRLRGSSLQWLQRRREFLQNEIRGFSKGHPRYDAAWRQLADVDLAISYHLKGDSLVNWVPVGHKAAADRVIDKYAAEAGKHIRTNQVVFHVTEPADVVQEVTRTFARRLYKSVVNDGKGRYKLRAEVEHAWTPETWNELNGDVQRAVRTINPESDVKGRVARVVKSDPDPSLPTVWHDTRDEILAVKQKALDDFAKRHGFPVLTIDEYDQLRTVLERPLGLQRRTRLLAGIAKRQVGPDGDWKSVFDQLARKMADKEGEAQLRAMAYYHPSLSPEDIWEAFKDRFDMNGAIRDTTQAITPLQKNAMERYMRFVSGVDANNSPALANYLKPKIKLDKRWRFADYQKESGAWSPRTSEDIISGKRAWSVDEEADYWLANYRVLPPWLTDDAFVNGTMFHDRDLYYEVQHANGSFDKRAIAELRLRGDPQRFTAEQIARGDDALQLKAMHDKATQRKWAIDRFGSRVFDSATNKMIAMPWLMTLDEIAEYAVKGHADELRRAGYVFEAAEAAALVRVIEAEYSRQAPSFLQSVVNRNLPFDHQAMNELAARVASEVMTTAEWKGWWRRDLAARGLDVWSKIWRAQVMEQLGFFASNAIDAPIKLGVIGGSMRRDLARKAKVRYGNQTIERTGVDIIPSSASFGDADFTTLAYQSQRKSLTERFRIPRSDHLLLDARVNVNAGLDALASTLPRWTGKIETAVRLRLAQRMAGGIWRDFGAQLMKRFDGDLDAVDLAIRKLVKQRIDQMFPTLENAGPIERFLNQISPFLSYTFKNHVVWIKHFLENPVWFNRMEHMQHFIAETNRANWDTDKYGNMPANYATNLIFQAGGRAWMVDLGLFSDIARGLAPITSPSKSMQSIISEWFRFGSPAQWSVFNLVTDGFGITGRDTWVPILDANGNPTGKYEKKRVPVGAPWSGQPVRGDELIGGLAAVQFFADAFNGGKIDEESVIRIVSKTLFFSEFKSVGRDDMLRQLWADMVDTDEEAAYKWLKSTPEGARLMEIWRARALLPKNNFLLPQDKVALTMEDVRPSNLRKFWLAGLTQNDRDELFAAWDRIAAIDDEYDRKIEAKGPLSQEDKAYRRARIWDEYQRNPNLMEADAFGRDSGRWDLLKPRFWVHEDLDQWYALLDQTKALESAGKITGDEARSQRESWLRAHPAAAGVLASERTDLQRMQDRIFKRADKLFDRLNMVNDRITAQKEAKDYADIEKDYFLRDLIWKGINRREIGEVSDEPGVHRLGVAKNILDWAKAKRSKSEQAEFEKNTRLGGEIANIVKRSKVDGKFDPARFVELMKRAPREVREFYFDSKPGTKERWAGTEKYINYMQGYGRLASAGNWDAANRYWDRLPKWVKDRYYEAHPEKAKRHRENSIYIGYMKNWVHLMDTNKSKAYDYFDSMPDWVKERYWAKHPGNRISKGRFLKYKKTLDGFFALMDKKDWDAAESYWNKMPSWVRNKYLADNPDSRLRDGFGGGGRGYSNARYRAYGDSMEKWIKVTQEKGTEAGRAYFRSLPEWMQQQYLKRHPDKKLMAEDNKMIGLLQKYFGADDAAQQRLLDDNPRLAQWLIENDTESERNSAIAWLYRSLPRDPWLRRIFKEKYPEVFSPEVTGQRTIDSTIQKLAQHPEIQEGFLRQLDKIWAGAGQAQAHQLARPKEVELRRMKRHRGRHSWSAKDVAERSKKHLVMEVGA